MAKTKPKPRKPKAISPNLKLDPKNARQHTPEGDAMIDASLCCGLPRAHGYGVPRFINLFG